MCYAIGPYRGSPDNCYKDGSGLCYNQNMGETVHSWRESCTDATWRDPACVKLFTNGTSDWLVSFVSKKAHDLLFFHACCLVMRQATIADKLQGLDSWGDVELRKCRDGSYCDLNLGDDIAMACCAAKEGLFINVVDGQVRIEPSITSSSASETPSASSCSTASTLTAPPAHAPPAPVRLGNEGGLSAGAKAGIGVGVAVVALAALAVVGWCIVVKGKRAKSRNGTSRTNPFDEAKSFPRMNTNQGNLPTTKFIILSSLSNPEEYPKEHKYSY
jgi:hypothetical protein